MTRTDRTLCIVLFLIFSSLYFATASGITCSNDGSHYALTRAIADEGRFAIESYDEYAEGNDIAVRGDTLFSDRPPGTALIASVAYQVGGWLPSPLSQLPSRHDPENPRLLYVMLVPAWTGAATVVLLYLVLRTLEVSTFSALTTSVVLGTGTTHWKYSSVLFSHAPSAFLVVLSIYIATRLARDSKLRRGWILTLGFVVGLAVLVEYSNSILVAAMGLYILLSRHSLSDRVKGLLWFGLGGLLPAGFLAYYNTVNFGGPFSLSYDYAVNYPWAGQVTETFNFPVLRGLRAMLIWGEGGGWCNPTCFNQGLFLLSPALLLSVLGLEAYVRRSRRISFLTLGLFVTYLLLFSKHRTFHGFTADGRYLVPFLALWCIPLAFWLEKVTAWGDRPAWQAGAYLLIYGTLFLSVCNIFLHVGFSYNYGLDLNQLDPMIAKPSNASYLLGQVFRNARNLPLLWLCDSLLLAMGVGGVKVKRRWGGT